MRSNQMNCALATGRLAVRPCNLRRCHMDLATLREQLPEYAKDLKLNLGTVLTTSSLSEVEAWGSGLAAALVSKNPLVIQALKNESRSRLTPEHFQGVAAAA